jgi:nitrogen fixation-related uncharacterized protein
MLVGLTAAVGAFLWAVARGQFSEQERARYLPLEEEDFKREVKVSRMSGYEMYGLIILACTGLGLSGAVLLCSLLWA